MDRPSQGGHARGDAEVRPVDDGEHAMADVAVFAPADFGTELDRARRVVRHLEEANRKPDREDVAACRQMVEDLGEQLAVQVRMPRSGRSKQLLAEKSFVD